MNHRHEQLMNIARKIVMDADASGGRMSASLLATPMYAEIDPDTEAPPLVQWCARAECVQLIGFVLRSEFGTVNNPVGEKFSEQLEIKDFVNCLQTSYPVARLSVADAEEREDAAGTEIVVEYVPINELTDAEVDALTNRMDRIGDKYHKHSDQLRRYHRARKMRSA